MTMHKIKDFFLRLIGRQPALNPSPEALAFIALANDEMQMQQANHAAQWKYGKEIGWSADLAAGIIAFEFANKLTGTCKFQAIGIYDEQQQHFAWGWSQKSIPASLHAHANLAKEWGKNHQHRAFIQTPVTCTMDDAWCYAAVAMKLANANSVYRGRIGQRYIFMTTEEVHIDDQANNIQQGHAEPSTATESRIARINSALDKPTAALVDKNHAAGDNTVSKSNPDAESSNILNSTEQIQPTNNAHWAKGRRDFKW